LLPLKMVQFRDNAVLDSKRRFNKDTIVLVILDIDFAGTSE